MPVSANSHDASDSTSALPSAPRTESLNDGLPQPRCSRKLNLPNMSMGSGLRHPLPSVTRTSFAPGRSRCPTGYASSCIVLSTTVHSGISEVAERRVPFTSTT